MYLIKGKLVYCFGQAPRVEEKRQYTYMPTQNAWCPHELSSPVRMPSLKGPSLRDSGWPIDEYTRWVSADGLPPKGTIAVYSGDTLKFFRVPTSLEHGEHENVQTQDYYVSG